MQKGYGNLYGTHAGGNLSGLFLKNLKENEGPVAAIV